MCTLPSASSRAALCLVLLFTALVAPAQQRPTAYLVAPLTAGDEASQRYVSYLQAHLQRRAKATPALVTAAASVPPQQAAGTRCIALALSPSLATDYAVQPTPSALQLSARTPEAMLWLLYQYMSAAGEDDARIDASDLPPAAVGFANASAGRFAFTYRGVYMPSAATTDALGILAAHSPDYDWGLWGHNLHKTFPGGTAPRSVWATVGGKPTSEQYCFTAEALYTHLQSYILDAYGEGSAAAPVRFAIMPADNALVCLCPACQRAGNTPQSATPAVAHLLRRLAQRFPAHRFYTASYASTQAAPREALPANCGVLVSSLDLPYNARALETAAGRSFTARLQAWRARVGDVIVWDGVRNFDDYLTPYPLLLTAQRRLAQLRALGATGVFLNGSTPAYAFLDEVQSATLAALLIAPALDVSSYTARALRRYYPAAHAALTPFYLAAEQRAAQGTLPVYGGIADAVRAGLHPAELAPLVEALAAARREAGDAERARLDHLLAALSYTQLECDRAGLHPLTPAAAEAAQTLLADLSARYPDLATYREAVGSTTQYLAALKTLRALHTPVPALRPGALTLEAAAPLPEDQARLTDGRYALPSDYHTAWVIVPDETFTLRLAAGAASAGDSLALSLLVAPRWRMHTPARLTLQQAGRTLCTITPAPVTPEGDAPFTRARIALAVPTLRADEPLTLVVQRAGGARLATAIDEVELVKPH